MKIAVQIFGHLRTYEQCYESLKTNLLDLYDCDVFMHTWDKLDHSTQVWHNYRVSDKGQSQKELEQIIKNCYHPKSFKIETQIVKDEGVVDTDGAQISLFGIKSMLYGMQQANILRENYEKQNNIKYEYVIVVRPDVYLKKPFSIRHFINQDIVDKKILYTAGHYKSNNIYMNDFRYVGGSDILFFAKPQILSEIFENNNKIIEQIKDINTTKYGPEYSIIYAIENMGIRVLFINYLWFQDFEVLRPQIPENSQTLKIQKKYKKLTKIFLTISIIEFLLIMLILAIQFVNL